MQSIPEKGFRDRPQNPEPCSSDSMSVDPDLNNGPDMPTLLNRLAELASIREELVARLRGQIERGEYVTQERIDTAAERMLQDLR